MNDDTKQEKKDGSDREYTRLIQSIVVLGLLFLSLVLYLTYIEFYAKDKFTNNTYNQRIWKKEEGTLRGDIVDRDNVLLAKSQMQEDKSQVRIYPFATSYAHVIGYNTRTYGKSQIELGFNKYLAGLTDFSQVYSDFASQISGEQKKGNTVELTISNTLQKKAVELLGKQNGAVVAIDPKTGEILCLASNPTFNPSSENLRKSWESLVQSDNAPFLPRATQGLYPPGSIFKTIMACAAIDNGLEEFDINDSGLIDIDGKPFRNWKNNSFGKLDLTKAFAVSSNIAFINIGQQLGETVVLEYARKFMFGREIPLDIPLNKSSLSYKGNMSKTELASVSIGQGKLLVTPLHMALMAATIANNGVMQRPILVKSIKEASGPVVYSQRPQTLENVVTASTAKKVKHMMVETVKSGTGRVAAIKGIEVAAKTGTAENERSSKEADKNHTWFICFAPADDPQIAVAVLLEYSGGSGGGTSANIATAIMRTWLEK